MAMFLGFDIGNTNTTVGLCEKDAVIPIKAYNFPTIKNADPDNLKKEIENLIIKNQRIENDIEGIAFSSVVPEINMFYHKALKSIFNIEPYEITHSSKLNITLNYIDPGELGIDRIVNAEAAFNEHKGNKIIIDIGTAATFCILLEDGTFDGGLISPGIGTTIESLSKSASQLPKIIFEKPNELAAKDTINAIKSGFFYGWLSLVEGIINRIENHYSEKFQTIITGGFSKIISDNIDNNNIRDEYLTLKGIKYIFDLNK